MAKVRALYEFRSEFANEMKQVLEGDVLEIIDRNVGDGWWRCRNERTQEKGLVPISYLEEIDLLNNNGTAGLNDSFNKPPPAFLPPQLPTQPAPGSDSLYANKEYVSDNDSDDSWGDFSDNGSSHYSEIATGEYGRVSQQQPQQPPQQQRQIYANLASGSSSVHSDLNSAFKVPPPRSASLTTNAISAPIANAAASSSVTSFPPSSTTLKNKNINRLSTFYKSSLDDYILGVNDVNVSSGSRLSILSDQTWASNRQRYTVTVNLLKKEGKKFSGLKKFTLYELVPSFNQTAVERRYKHFDWLHDRLSIKFGLVAVPPIPEKRIHNLYKDEVVEYRCVQFQKFVDWICAHPVLSDSDVWLHFITCATDPSDEKRWKSGKRQAERDVLIGPRLCLAIQAPDKTLLASTVDAEVDSFAAYINQMETALKNCQNLAQNMKKFHQGPCKRDFSKIGEVFGGLARALEGDQRAGAAAAASTTAAADERKLIGSLQSIAASYSVIAKMYDDQQRIDWEPFFDNVTFLRGIVCGFHHVLDVYRLATDKKRECEKRRRTDNKMDQAQLTEAQRRVDVITYAILAEINHFRGERFDFLNAAVRSFLEQQIHFHRKICEQLEDVLKCF